MIRRVQDCTLSATAQRQLRELATQFGSLAGDAGRAEAAAVGFTGSERDAGQALDPVPAIGIDFPDHPVEVDPLMGEGPDRGVAGRGEQLAESLCGLGPQAL